MKTPLLMAGLWIVSTLAWWGFAFAPFGKTAPDWFLAAKSACFGTLPNGLPDASGWLLLVLGPASFLIGLLLAWRDELRESLRSFLSMKIGRAVLVGLVLVALVEGYFVGREIRAGLRIASFDFANDSQEDLPVNYPRSMMDAPEFRLIDQRGEEVSLASLQGEVVVLTFAFAHCSTVCPTLVYQCKQGVLNAGLEQARLLVVTLDPWRDRPSTLATLAEKWKIPPGSHVLSGAIDDVNRAIKSYGVATARDQETGDIIHPAMVFVIDQRGKLAFTFNDPPSRWITQAIGRLHGIGAASN